MVNAERTLSTLYVMQVYLEIANRESSPRIKKNLYKKNVFLAKFDLD